MNQLVNELYKPARKNFPRRRTVLKGIGDLWQTDLAEFIPYVRINRGHKYILFVIDCFSKFLWTEPLKNKSASEVVKAMTSIIKRAQTTPRNLQSDMGKEYYNSEFKNLMKKHNINHYSSYSVKKAAMAERVIRTIKTKIYKMFNLRGKHIWIDKLREITDDYNNTKHSVIKMKPKDVSKKHEQSLLTSVYSHIKVAGPAKLRVGDVVRISKYKSIFDKGYHPSWSTELFKIIRVQATNPVTYLLEDMRQQPISGGFYEYELQKAKYQDVYLVERVVRKKGDKLFVKWLGLDTLHNSWINKKDVMK